MCTVNHRRNRRILPHLETILGWRDREDWDEAPDDWEDMDIVHRGSRVHPPCLICGDWSGFCRVVEVDDVTYWADLCSEHTDPDHLLGLS